MRRRFERTARQEERGGHDVEVPPLLAGDCERLWHVRTLHVAELERHPRNPRRNWRDRHALIIIDTGRVGSNDGEHDIMLMQNFVVLQIMQKRGWRQICVLVTAFAAEATANPPLAIITAAPRRTRSVAKSGSR